MPVKSLFDYLEDNYTVEQLTEIFPTVTIDIARRVLERSESSATAPSEFRALQIP